MDYEEEKDLQCREGAINITIALINSKAISNGIIEPKDLGNYLDSIYTSLQHVGIIAKGVDRSQAPVINPKKSITPEYIICLEDGAKLKMLKRYLRTQYNMSPEEYKAKWGLPSDYPMVAPEYAKLRSQYAKDIGLGTARVGTKKKATKVAKEK